MRTRIYVKEVRDAHATELGEHQKQLDTLKAKACSLQQAVDGLALRERLREAKRPFWQFWK